MKTKFNLDKFINALELDEDMALADAGKAQRDKGETYRKCPRCGTRKWRILNANNKGKAVSCDKCENSEQ
jgi:NADH pyrophosphatase NudC (nudix superfamily)